MKANQFFNKILDKWPVKVCCLIIAIALYLFHQASLTDKRSFVIPLQVIEEGGVIHTGNYTENVTVTIKANTEQISSVNSKQLNAYINLNDIAQKGDYTIPVHVSVADEILAFDPFEIKVKPEYIKIRVENKDLKYIPVEASIVGEPEHGYEVTSVQIEPGQLEVIGPESILENTKKIYTEKIDVSGLAKKEVFEVDYKPLNKLLLVTDNRPFEVTVTIEPSIMLKTIENVSVSVISLRDNLYLKDDVLPVTVILEGTVPVLENYEPGRRFITLDMQKITEPGEYDIQLNFNAPSYLTVKESSQNIVHVVVLEKEEDVEEPLAETEAAE